MTAGEWPCGAPPPAPPCPPPHSAKTTGPHLKDPTRDRTPGLGFPCCARSQRVGGSSRRGDGAPSARAYWVWRDSRARVCAQDWPARRPVRRWRWAGGELRPGGSAGGGRGSKPSADPALAVSPAGLPCLWPLPCPCPAPPMVLQCLEEKGHPCPCPSLLSPGFLLPSFQGASCEGLGPGNSCPGCPAAPHRRPQGP